MNNEPNYGKVFYKKYSYKEDIYYLSFEELREVVRTNKLY